MEEWCVANFIQVTSIIELSSVYNLGAPVQIAQIKDDPVLAKDRQRNNNFTFDQVDSVLVGRYFRC